MYSSLGFVKNRTTKNTKAEKIAPVRNKLFNNFSISSLPLTKSDSGEYSFNSQKSYIFDNTVTEYLIGNYFWLKLREV